MTHVFVGIESGNDMKLAKLNKNVTCRDNAICLEMLRDEPIVTQMGS